MATEIVRLRPYGAALKDEWTHFPAGGEASARTNKNKTSVETPGTTEGVETATSGKSVSVKAGVAGAAYKLPEGAKVLKAILWVYARAGTAEEDVTVIGRVGPKAEPNATLKLNATAFGWHSAETPKSVLEEITPKSLEEASLAATSNKTTGTADKLVEWHIELEIETGGKKTGEGSATASVALTAATTAKGAVQGSAAAQAALRASTTGVKTATGTTIGQIATRARTTAVLISIGHATGQLAPTGLTTAKRVTNGTAHGQVALTAGTTGQRVATGQTTGRLAASATAKGAFTVQSTVTARLAVQAAVTGRLVATHTTLGRIALMATVTVGSSPTLPALVRFTNWKAATIRVTNQKATGTRTSMEKAAMITTSNQKTGSIRTVNQKAASARTVNQ